MTMKPGAAIRTAWEMFPSLLSQREEAAVIDSWLRNEQEGSIFVKRKGTQEFTDLEEKANTGWASMLVTSVAQTLFMTGMRQPGVEGNTAAWTYFQRNAWDRRQSLLYRSVLGHGEGFAYALPSRNEAIPVMRPVSIKRGTAFWGDDEDDEWATSFLMADRVDFADGTGHGWTVQLLDESARYFLSCNGDGYDVSDWTFIEAQPYPNGPLPGAPVARYANRQELDGFTYGEVEPFLPLLRRIDQDTFDRLVVQRFGAWKVRYATGLLKPSEQAEVDKMIAGLTAADLLVNESPDAKFGTLDATDIAGYIAARDADLRDLSALSQTPPYQLLGLSSNLQAESLKAAREGLELKSTEVRTSFGESNEEFARIAAWIVGDEAAKDAYDLQTMWRDTDPRSLTQAADAGAKFADSLGIPAQMLWGRLVPGWTDTDTTEALRLIEEGDEAALEELRAQLAASDTGADDGTDPQAGDVDPDA